MAKIIAHRGASKQAPQNTVAAFSLAREMKCDGFECDVHLTKDGHAVICHDHNIDETSNGTGYIKDMTLDELRSFDFGSYFSDEFVGEKIPTLEEFYETAKGLDVINIEIKPPLDKNLAVVGKTLEMAKEFGILDNLLISSFSDEVLIESKKLFPLVPTGLLYDPNSEKIDEIFDDPFSFAEHLQCNALHPVYFYIDEEYIQTAHEKGFIVNAWTCNSKHVIQTLISLGCDGIITDVPDFARQILLGL